jgi:hypothetical protein
MGSRLQLERIARGLREWNAQGKWSLAVRFAAIGAFSGLVAWGAVFLASLFFDIGRPSGMALVLAVPRGALFGAILAFILRAYWRRSPG